MNFARECYHPKGARCNDDFEFASFSEGLSFFVRFTMILITGGAGFIGSNLQAALTRCGYETAVIDWLGQTLYSAIYISGPTVSSTLPTTPLDPRIVSTVQGWPGVQGIEILRSAQVGSPAGPIAVSAVGAPG